jgi:pyrroline-5-carboxylate reductase
MSETMSQANSSSDRKTPAADGLLKSASLHFVGCGVMAEAMIAGILHEKLIAPQQIVGSHPRAERRTELESKYGIRMLADNREAVQLRGPVEPGKGSMVVLAVKPQRLKLVLEELSGSLSADDLVVSIVAGAQLDTIIRALRHSRVVRAMPNTPAQIGKGITVWTATPEVDEGQRLLAGMLFRALGRELQVEVERRVDMATALSATGPTYVFLFMEALIDAGVYLGFSRHDAQELVLETMLGSVLFARESHKHPAELRNQVTSPGGTSAAAIYQMEKGAMRTVLSKAVYSAYQRALVLAGEVVDDLTEK